MRFLWLTAFTLITVVGAPLNDPGLQAYFDAEVKKISAGCLTAVDSRPEWERQRTTLRAQLFEMLGLEPLPNRGELNAVVTGTIERDDFSVKKLHFQSSPGLYVTASFYLPRKIDQPLPTVLYLCGHGRVKTNGVSYGNKAAYQHHGAWFARNGYACLMLDTIELGEIEGIHHGTYREGMWWWNSRGYTPAGVEAWNAMRALDFLETQPEVDKTRLGVTGRSGGGAYSWWIAALDDRIKVAAPVAGLTDLEDHVVEGVVEGHCDCMYFVNTHRWDYPAVAALVAPRPLLLANSDKDSIFPLDGVIRTHQKLARIYDLYGASTNLGLLITEGPHKDTQDLQLPVFRWFNRHLKGEDPVIEMAATRFFNPQELKVFAKNPADEITSRIHESFVPAYKDTARGLPELRVLLKEKAFKGWPEKKSNPRLEKSEWKPGIQQVQFDAQEHVRLSIYLKASAGQKKLRVHILPESARTDEIEEHLKSEDEFRHAVLIVRGIDAKDRNAIQIRRRYMLVGQTLDGMRVWDILRGLEVLRTEVAGSGISFSGNGAHHWNALMASIFDKDIKVFSAEAPSGDSAPDYLNLLKYTAWEEIQRAATR